MSYSEEKFKSIYGRMGLFEKIAAQNGYELKDLLIKKVGADEELAEALIGAWKSEQAHGKEAAAAPAISQEQFGAYLRDMGSFQRLAGLQGIELQDWLKSNCGVDDRTAQELIRAAGVRQHRKSDSLLQVLSRPAEPQEPAVAPEPARKKEAAEDDIVITISGAPAEFDENKPGPRQPARAPGVDAQIERLHALADMAQDTEPVHLIQELNDARLKKNYLTNPVSPEEKEQAERLLRNREDQRKTLLRLETRLEEAHQTAAILRGNPPKLFGREEYRTKIRETEDAIQRTEQQIAALTAREAERQTAYLAAVSALERHAKARRNMDWQYGEDAEKFNSAKDIIIRALRWSQLELPSAIRAGSVLDHLGWYESFFKAFPEKFDMPVHGWIKACDIVRKLACEYPQWRGRIDSIHFVLDGEMKSLKDAIRLFLDGFVAQLQAPFSAVCQLEVVRSEAEKTGGAVMRELADQREHKLRQEFEQSVIEFCADELPGFFIIQAVSEYLNFGLNVQRFFDPPEPAGKLSRPGQDPGGFAKMFGGLAEESARRLETCFTGSDEIAKLRGKQAGFEACAECRQVIRADFEKLFTASRERLKRYV